MEMSGDNVYINTTFKPEKLVNTGETSAEGIYEHVNNDKPDFRDTAAGTVQGAGTVHTHTHQTRSR